MLTMNADEHPIMRRMHKPDPKLSHGQQDKRSVVAIDDDMREMWLSETTKEAQALIRLTPIEAIVASPVPKTTL
jgi:putative SOS response-associated peptidase YedK